MYKCDRACKNQPCEYKTIANFFFICPIITYKLFIYEHDNISVTTAEVNGLSSEIYGKRIPHSELKILAIIQLGVICAHMVDFCRPSHKYY